MEEQGQIEQRASSQKRNGSPIDAVVQSLAGNFISTVTGLAVLVGFLFQLIFWWSVGEMPRLDFSELVTVFSSAAIVGLLLLLGLILPLYTPALIWISYRDLSIGALKKRGSTEGEVQRHWECLLKAAAWGGVGTLVLMSGLAFLGASLGKWAGWILPFISPLLVAAYAEKKFGGSLVFLSLIMGFGGSSAAVPMGILAAFAARESGESPVMSFLLMIALSLVFLWLSFIFVKNHLSVRKYAVLSCVLLLVGILLMLPFKMHTHVSLAIARALGQGAVHNVQLAVSGEGCWTIQTLSYVEACALGSKGYGVTKPVAILNRQGDPWLIEVSPEKEGGSYYRIRVPSSVIMGTAQPRERSALNSRSSRNSGSQ